MSAVEVFVLVVILCAVTTRPVTCITCAFNLCALPGICNGKTCVQDETCSILCTCENSTLPECINATTSTILNNVTGERHSGCSCTNGHCSTNKDNQTSCVCDSGWGGERCDLQCTLSCPEGKKCVIPVPAFPSMAICQDVPIVTETTPIMLTTTTEYSYNRTYNVCDPSYFLRPKHERECFGFKCLYGTCQLKDSKVSCECDPGAVGEVCQNACCRECMYGTCYYYMEEKREMCNCQANYSGPYCEFWDPPTTYAPPEEVTWHYWVVGACVIVLIILLTLVVVVPYILWRNRVILVMKVVHYFQGYEDDDDRQWDAFISYKSIKADETFVVRKLFPKLEKELGFKVNVHFRDFVPGETIANNIITAVQSSRRTIMIITPAYVTSEFTKFEYQVAQQEMLKRKHRIIPILLEDISECKDTMDPNLKVILNSVTYIEWPKDGNEKKQEKFWKRVELSMPKIKNRPAEQGNNQVTNNGRVHMIKPEDINVSFTKDKRSSKEFSNGSTNIYSITDERKLEPEEDYDTLNESEMQSRVFVRKPQLNTESKQDNNLNILKIEL